MRRSDREIKDRETLEEILRSNIICRVAFQDTPYPYIIPLNYGYHNNKLYFHSANKGKKLDLLVKNNHVCFEIDTDKKLITKQPGGTTMLFKSIVGFGQLKILESVNDKQFALKVLMKHHGGAEVDHSLEMLNRVTMLELEIDSMTGKQNL